MRIQIITKRKPAYEKEVYEVTLPGRDGELSVLDFHQPFLYRLRKGLVKIKENKSDKEAKFLRIRDGLARFRENSLLILCERE